MKIKTNNRGAFTLIEMILAVGISVIVLVAINTVLFTALRLRNAASEAVNSATVLDQAVATLRRDLQCTVTPKASGLISGDFKVGNVISTGANDPVSAEFCTATGVLSASQPWGDIQRVSYELKSSPSGRDLYRTVTRNLLTYSTPDVEDQLMVRGVASVEFSCFDGAQWSGQWDTSDVTSVSTNLPMAVRVRIQLSGDDAKNAQPVELIVPIDTQSRTNSTNTVGG